jgi:hypothetical protein
MTAHPLPLFPPGMPTEDPHAWANDSCFLTRLAREGNGALACVARVADESDESHPDLTQSTLPFVQRVARNVSRSVGAWWERLWKPHDQSLEQYFGPMADLESVPVEQLRVGLADAADAGDQIAAAHIAAELARRREPVSARASPAGAALSPARADRFLTRASMSPPPARRAGEADAIVGSLWGAQRPRDSDGDGERTVAGRHPMWVR